MSMILEFTTWADLGLDQARTVLSMPSFPRVLLELEPAAENDEQPDLSSHSAQ